MLGKYLTALGIDGITIRIMVKNILVRRAACKNICFNVSITLIDKTDGKNPKKREREDYWRRTLKTCSPFGLSFENSVTPYS